MEHSLLHGLQLTGLLVLLGGAIFVLGLLQPACRRLGLDPARDRLAGALSDSAARWVTAAALVAAVATILDVFVQVAETLGVAPFGVLDPGLVRRFATGTVVGQLALTRVASLVLAAAVTRIPGALHWRVIAA